ncbi:MAG: hypothetical protein ACOYM0_09010 [Bacteroidales bacterium]
MRKKIFAVFSVLTFSCLVLFSGCTSKNATTGTLTVMVVDYLTNVPIPNELVYIATSYQNLQNHIWVNSLYTDANGKAFFRDLTPFVMYYDTEHWENYGAIQVYAGIDQTTILYVNTPFVKK